MIKPRLIRLSLASSKARGAAGLVDALFLLCLKADWDTNGWSFIATFFTNDDY
jgi:hypothetical protein